ncbi:MAG: putative Ig domain-containing protein [Terriglobales bacterium]
MTTSCGTVATAAGAQNDAPNDLNVSGSLPAGTVNHSYNAVLAVSGGRPPYHFSVKTGALPPGISLSPATGALSGTPTTAGKFSFEVIVTDSPLLNQGNQTFVIDVAGSGNVEVSVSPTSATLLSSQTQQFTAAVSGTFNTGVTWSATAGSVNATGLYSAPIVTMRTNVVVTATSNADTTKSSTTAVTVNPTSSNGPEITTGTLPQGEQGEAYSQVFTATGGTTPYSWSISAGTPPPGIAMNANGNFAGTPTTAGTFNFTVMVTDATSKTATGNFSGNIVTSSGYDGPAQLPTEIVQTAMADTPAPGTVVNVNAGGDVQSALNNAQCGETITLQAGATYSSALTLPAKPCDDEHWIIIRTSAPDSALPPEGQRLTPCYAGVASLPNRPAYSCSKPQNVLAKISVSKGGNGAIVFASGATHYRLVGLEITRPVDKVNVIALVGPSLHAPADHIVIDRCWIHGTAQDETRRGVYLNGTTNVAVVDSYLNDFHCEALWGTCTDSQTMSGGVGNNASGPWDIEDNFLEAAGEDILIGGGAATIVAHDITIRHNHFYKVPQWQKGVPGFVGGYHGDPFVVKNLFEIKSGVRILFEDNILEYSWGGFTQYGQSILITPRNDYNKFTKENNLCSVCAATDITVRYNTISHTGGGINIANDRAVDGLGAQAGERYSIHDIVVDDIDAEKYTGDGGLFLVMNNWPDKTLNNVSIRHVTGFPDLHHFLMTVKNELIYPQMFAFTFSDNIMVVPGYPVWATGTDSCAAGDVPVTVIANCFKTYTFTNSVLAASPKAFPSAKWPGGNFFPATVNDVGFVNYNNGNGGNYQLQASSPYKGKASDGTDPGANIDAVNAAIQGVE